MEDERLEIGKRLRDSREYLDLTQQDVATAIKLSRTAISQIETGQRRIELFELKQLAKLYQRPVSYFTGEQEPETPEDVKLLMRKASRLSETDQKEILQFAEWLLSRSDDS